MSEDSKVGTRVSAAFGRPLPLLFFIALMSMTIGLVEAGGLAAGDDLRSAAARGELSKVKAILASKPILALKVGSAAKDGGEAAWIDSKDAIGQTPLLLAVSNGHTDVAKALIDAGADINAVAANSDTPWLLAGARGRAEILTHMLPKKPNLGLRNRYGGSALIPACERGHLEAVRVLLTSGIAVDHVNNFGWTCLLEIAILSAGGPRDVEVTRLVLAAGADPNLADRDGVSALAHARKRGLLEIARLIAAKGGH